MTEDMLNAVLKRAGCTLADDATSELPEGRSLTLYVAHAGVSLSVSRVRSLRRQGELIAATNNKGEEYVLALADIFAASIAGGSDDKPTRKAGFLG